MAAPAISVVMPHFGCEAYLAAAVGSILEQSLSPAEVIVIDDGSPTSQWLSVLQPFRHDSRLRLLRSASRVGMFRIINATLPLARGSLIAFQDADDLSHPDRFRHQFRLLEGAGADIVGCRFICIDADGAPLGWWRLRHLWAFSCWIRLGLGAHNPTALIRRTTVEALGGFDGTTMFGADSDFMWRAGLAFKIANTREALYYYRQRRDSLTGAPETGRGSAARKRYVQELQARMRAERRQAATRPSKVVPARPNDVEVHLTPV